MMGLESVPLRPAVGKQVLPEASRPVHTQRQGDSQMPFVWMAWGPLPWRLSKLGLDVGWRGGAPLALAWPPERSLPSWGPLDFSEMRRELVSPWAWFSHP